MKSCKECGLGWAGLGLVFVTWQTCCDIKKSTRDKCKYPTLLLLQQCRRVDLFCFRGLQLIHKASEMESDAKSYEEASAGCRVKVWSPRDKSFFEGVVSSNGKNVVVYKNGVEATLKLKKGVGTPFKDRIADQGETFDSPLPSTPKFPEKDDIEDYGEELVGYKVAVSRPNSKTISGIVASYDHSSKQHTVVYADGAEEMLDLRKYERPAVGISQDKARKTHVRAFDASYTYSDDDMDSYWHSGKKLKGQSSGLRPPSASPTLRTYLKVPKLEFDASPTTPKPSAIISNDGLVDVNGYRVKATLAPLLEAIFAKYGDITARCLYRSASVRASLLEVICSIVEKLQQDDLDTVLSNLEVMKTEILDVEDSKIRVSWLHEHLAKVCRVAALKERSLQLKKTKARSGFASLAATKEMKQRHAELVLAQERFKEAEKRANAMRVVYRKIESDNEECQLEEHFWQRQVDDLLL